MQEHRRTLTALLAALRLEPDERARRAEAGVADAVWDQPQAAPGRFAVPADITELLRGLQLSQHGAALVDRLGVRSVADLSHVTDAVLHDALPEQQSTGRDALIAAVEMAMWAAGVAAAPRAVAEAEEAQPDDAAPHAGNAQPDEPAWLAEWRLMEQGNGAAPAEAVAAPAPVAADAPLGAATSADPCVSCRRDRRLAVNTPCGHAFMCRACTDGFRGDNGPICNRCRQPSTVSDTAQSLTCCICSEEVTRTREMFYFRPCGHMTCVGCAVQLVRAALGDADGKFPFRCEPCRIEALEQRTEPPAPVPVDDLLRRLPMLRADIEAVGVATLSDDEVARFRRFNAVSLVPVNRRAYCPAAACGAMMVVEPDAVTRSRAAGGALKRCAACPTTFCLGCSATPFHEGASCEAHAAHLARHAGTDTATAAFIQQTTRPCPGCGLRVTHYRGHACHHISPGRGCPQCATHWCFRCGAAAPTPPHRCEAPSCVGHLFCDDTCTCPDCPVCKPGQPCTGAAGCNNDRRCRSCRPL
jgi:hypothetical protein